MARVDLISPCLWFDREAEQAAEFYVSVFPDSQIDDKVAGTDDWPGGKAGETIVVRFTLRGMAFQALNGGPSQPFNDRVSLSVSCRDQEEVDRYWDQLLAGGGEPLACGWLKDRYGVRWQIVPEVFFEMVQDPDQEKCRRVMDAMSQMIKFDIEGLRRACQPGS